MLQFWIVYKWDSLANMGVRALPAEHFNASSQAVRYAPMGRHPAQQVYNMRPSELMITAKPARRGL